MENIAWDEVDKKALHECAVHFVKILFCSQGFEVFQTEKTMAYFVAKAPDHSALRIYTALSRNNEPPQLKDKCEADDSYDSAGSYICIVRYTDTAPEYYLVSVGQWKKDSEFWKNLIFNEVTKELLEHYHCTTILPIYLD